jgi:hypothetical protein
MVNGKLHTDANENEETVLHIAVPVETSATSSIASKKSALEFDSAWLRPGTPDILAFASRI